VSKTETKLKNNNVSIRNEESNENHGMKLVMAPSEPLSLKQTPEIRPNPTPVHKELKPQPFSAAQVLSNPAPTSQPYVADISSATRSSAAPGSGRMDALLEAAMQAQGKNSICGEKIVYFVLRNIFAVKCAYLQHYKT